MKAKLKYHSTTGKVAEIELDVGVYKAAAELNMDLRQYLRHKVADCDHSKGDVIDQMMTFAGFSEAVHGMPAMTMAHLAGMKSADGFRRPDGSDNSLGGRLLYPQMILETLQLDARRNDGSGLLPIWEQLIAVSRNLNGQKVDQPIIDFSAPEESRSGRIAQLAEPETIISITTGDRSYRIPTYSVGLMVSNEAMEATTIDLVRVVMGRQSRGNRIRHVKEMLKAMVFGDVDLGMAALPVLTAGSFDDAIITNGVITKKAYIKWLHSVQDTTDITRILTDIDSALAVDTGLLPNVTGPDSSKIITPWGGLNLSLPQPQIIPFKTEDFGANVLVGLDPTAAIQRFVNVSASYDGIEEYVMRKATGFRVDYGEMATRLFDDAWSVLSLEQ